jgi:hypothetical protein
MGRVVATATTTLTMFDPNLLANARGAAAAQRRVTEWALSHFKTLPFQEEEEAQLSVRQVACTDPACATPEGVEVIISLTAKEWSVANKILKSASSCIVEEVHAAVVDLVKVARPRAVAAKARQTLELKHIQSEPSGASLKVSILSEKFVARVLARVSEEFESESDRTATIQLLEIALQMEKERAKQHFIPSQTDLKLTTAEKMESTSPSQSPSLSSSTAAMSTQKDNMRSPRAQIPSFVASGPSMLMAADGDESKEMNRHSGGRQGGISCPCCNPDDPQFLVDKMLMM